MLSAAKHLKAHRERPFACAQGDKERLAAFALRNPGPVSQVDAYSVAARARLYYPRSDGFCGSSIVGAFLVVPPIQFLR